MMRSLISLLLSLTVLLTSHSAAIARGSATAVDQMVICSGEAVITVYVDRNGQPTQATHLCPDCALHVLAAALPPAISVRPAATAGRILYWTPSIRTGGAGVADASARAPPVLT